MERDDLIEEVKFGRMTPEQAEAWAARLGLGPLITPSGSPGCYANGRGDSVIQAQHG